MREIVPFSSKEYQASGHHIRAFQKLGLLNSRNMHWAFYDPRNFGDWIGPYIYTLRTGRTPFYYKTSVKGLSTGYYTAGSIMRRIKHDDRAIVWGSGVISKDDIFARPKKVLLVRGPETRDRLHRLGYDTTDTFGDPAVILPTLYSPKVEKKYNIGIIPHYVDYPLIKQHEAAEDHLLVVDVTQDISRVVEDILRCDRTISSSLHGVIVSHAYGIPCTWVRSINPLSGDGIKYADYFQSVNIKNQKPADLQLQLATKDLEAIAADAFVPDMEHLKSNVLRTCPFPSEPSKSNSEPSTQRHPRYQAFGSAKA